MIISLDIATAVGWCLGGPAPAGPPRFGTLNLPGVANHLIDRSCVGLFDWLNPLCQLARVKICLIEAPWLAPGRDEHNVASAFYLVGAARTAASKAGCVVVLQNVQTVRHDFIGNGNMPRDEAKPAVFKRCQQLGWSPNNYDESDAGALFYWGMSNTYPKWRP